MKDSKVKILLAPICLLFIILGPQCQSMDQPECEMTLVGEDHSTTIGMNHCYEQIRASVGRKPQRKVNFFVEKDTQRVKNAFKEVYYLSDVKIFDIPHEQAIEKFRRHIEGLRELTDTKLYNEVYTNIMGKPQEDGLLQNRFLFLKIIHDFHKNIKFFPIDGNFKQVTDHKDFKKLLINPLFSGYYEAGKGGNQNSIDTIMSHPQVTPIRDDIMIKNLTAQIEPGARNIAIVGFFHREEIAKAMKAMKARRIRVESPNL